MRRKKNEAFDIRSDDFIALANNSPSEPYFIGKPVPLNRVAHKPEDEECAYELEHNFEGEFGVFKSGDVVLDFQKYEPVTSGSLYYTRTDKIFTVYAEVVIARKVQLEAPSGRLTRDSRLHLPKVEQERITNAIADMPDWCEDSDSEDD